jgi:DNA-directed RNA polymerase specialized sigma24 family protein
VNDNQFDTISQKVDDILDKLGTKIDALIRLRVLEMTEGKSQSDQIWLFHVAGLSPKEIAANVRTSSNTVRVVLSNLRKARRERHGKKGER